MNKILYVQSTLTNNYYAIWDIETIRNIESGKYMGYRIVSKKEYQKNIKKLGL